MASTKKNEFSLLKQRADKYALTVSQRFSKAVNDILALQKEYSLEEGEVFSFDDNPRIARQVQDILRELHSATETAIHNGIRLEWKNANDAIDSLLESRMGKEAMHDATFAGWMARDNEARDAFMKRRVAGMSLSDRIWRTEKQLRTEMELALSVSIGEGKSASEISREVRKYLQEPDRLFRRVRMSDGSMRLSRAAAAYHPGQGVYRSSYKNAMRLARTETNMAYRAADFERWKRLDFVTGVRIGLSGSHPDYDVCDRLRGDYPKDFKFSGWHPNCFCNAVPITVSDDDFVKMQQAMLAGEDYDVSSQMVKDVPDGFDEWAKENKDRIIQARKNGTSPYFVRDNEKYVRIALGEEPRPRLMSTTAPTIIPEPGNMPEPGRSTLGAEFPDFKPQIAKSIDEAQDILRKYCEPNPMDRTFKGEVSLKGISLENANEISTAIQRLYESMDIGKISGIKVIDGNSATGKKIFSSSESVACYVPTSKGIYINKAILKDKATFDAYLKRSADAFETVKKNLDKLSPIQRKVAEKYIAAGRELVDDSIQGLITHEMGHHVLGPMTMPVKLFNGVGVNIDKIALKLSGYASTNKTEYLAESFVSWMKGEKVIDQNIQAYLDGLISKAAAVPDGLTAREAAFIKEMASNISMEDKKLIAKHYLEIEKELGYKKGAAMSVEEADKQNANPNYHKDKYFRINCATCAPCYALRSAGFEITAKARNATTLNGWMAQGNSFKVWSNPDGTEAKPTLYSDWLSAKKKSRFSSKLLREFFDEACKEEGIYITTVGWKGGGGHATIVQRMADGNLYYIEPQVYNSYYGSKMPISVLLNDMSMNQISTRGVMRVDNKIFNTKYLSIFEKKA